MGSIVASFSLYCFSCECNLAMYSGALTKGETVVEGTEETRDGTKDGRLQHETLGACCWEWIVEKRHALTSRGVDTLRMSMCFLRESIVVSRTQ